MFGDIAEDIIGAVTSLFESASDDVASIDQQQHQIDEQIRILGEIKGTYVNLMQEVYRIIVIDGDTSSETGEHIDSLTEMCDFLYEGPTFYSGTGEGTITSNIADWRGFDEVPSPVTGQTYFDVSVDPPVEKEYGTVAPAETFSAYEEVTNDMDTELAEQACEPFDFAVDYIHKPQSDGEGSYGINDRISSLGKAKDMLGKNKDKISQGAGLFGGLL